MTGRRPPDEEASRPQDEGGPSPKNIAAGDPHTVTRRHDDPAAHTRAWFGKKWFDGCELPDRDAAREITRLVVVEQWSLEEALCAVQAPASWADLLPADDPTRDLSDAR
jgi:hypothetical protein